MSENVVNVESLKALNPAEIQKTIETIKKLIKLGRGLAALTPTQLDDKVIDILDKVVTAVEPFTQDSTIIDVLNLVLELFKKDNPQAALEKAKEALA